MATQRRTLSCSLGGLSFVGLSAGRCCTVQPGTTNGAGVSFEITPVDADVFVDGTYAGRVSNFGPRSQPLSVTPGRHLIEIRRQGYQTLSFDADVVAGQVIPYEGTMQPLVR